MTNTAEKIVARAEFLDRLFNGMLTQALTHDEPIGIGNDVYLFEEMRKPIEYLAEIFGDLARTKKELGTSAAIETVRRVGVLEAEMRALREKIEKLEHPDDPDMEAAT